MYDEDSITFVETLPAPAEKIWDLVLNDRSQWWPQLEFEPRSGASLKDQWSAGAAGRPAWIATGIVLGIDENGTAENPAARQLRYRWAQPGWGAETRVSITVEPAADDPQNASTLTIVEKDFVQLARGIEQVIRNHRDWETHVADLKKALSA
ncbi:SRPBCC family protein [Micrococcoides hystricis]|uniref:SRPBCC domain-containing protein n=1 Tax=Micrococcoides hystricis TaxID=1572761 RepID=A0ABV6PAS1_9MICC